MKTKKKHEVMSQCSWMLSSLERIVGQEPDRPLLVVCGEPRVQLTRRVFNELVGKFAQYLSKAGIGAGKRLILDIDLGMGREAMIAWGACQMLGAQAFFWPVDMRFRHAQNETTASDQLNEGLVPVLMGSLERAKVWIANDEKNGISGRRLICAGYGKDCIESVFPEGLSENVIAFDDACSGCTEPVLACSTSMDNAAALVYSQGSHQQARLIELSYTQLRAQAEDLMSETGIDSESCIFIDLKSIHTVSLVAFATCLLSGATFVCFSTAVPVSGILAAEGITHAFLLPSTLARGMNKPNSLKPMARRWNQLCVNSGKYRQRASEGHLRLLRALIHSVCIQPICKKHLPKIKMIISYGNHFDSRVGELLSYFDIPVMNAYTLSEFGIVHLHRFMGSGGFVKSVEARIKGGVLSVKANRPGMPFVCTDDLVFEDERCGLCTNQSLWLQLGNGTKVDVSPMRQILCREPMIDEVFIFGENRPYLTSLIYLNPTVLKSWVLEQKLPDGSFEEMVKNPQVYSHIRKIVDNCNLRRAPSESIQKIALLTCPLAEDPRILTPCGLTRRTDVEHRYQRILDSFYSENF